MPNQPRDSLLARFRALPAAAPLLGRLDEVDGVHLVGGAVRDLMLGGSPTDLDLVVEGDLDPVLQALQTAGRIYARFGTCTLELDGFRYDLARARREHYARPGALPTVSPADLTEDLARRDFTVNAIALALTGARAGTIEAVDLATEDLREHRLRVLNDGSFADDPTRLLRLVRYASRLGFAVEPHTLALATAAVQGGVLDNVSGARIGTELRLLSREADPVAALAMLRELGLDRALGPPGFGLADPGLVRRALALLPADGHRGLLALAAASIDVPPLELVKWLDQLAFAADERDTIVSAASGARRLAEALQSAQRPSAVAAAAGTSPPELVALAGAVGPAGEARDWLQSLRHVRLEINGRDLRQAGVPPGPAIGEGLRAALAAKLDGRVHTRAEELDQALRGAAGSG